MTRKDYVVLSVASGAVALIAFVFPAQVIGDLSGLFGASPSYVLYELNMGPALAKDARSRQARPLTDPEAQQLKTSIRECGKPASELFCSIVENYAMKGEVHAQLIMGTMLDGQYPGSDKSQRAEWLKVAFAQGGLAILQQAFSKVESSYQAAGIATNGPGAPMAMYNPYQGSSASTRNPSSAYDPAMLASQPGVNSAHDYAVRQALLESAMQPRPDPLEFHSQPYAPPGTPPLPDYGQNSPTVQAPAIIANNPQPHILSPAGPQNYVDQNGTVYAGAGPHGVINTQTGEFSPTN